MESQLRSELKRFATKKEGQVKSVEWVGNVIARALFRHKTAEAKEALEDVRKIIERARILETEELMRLKKQLSQTN